MLLALRIRVLVPMALLLLEQRAPQTMPTFVRLVPADTTKPVTLVLDVDLVVVLEQEKHLLVLLHQIVYVHKIRVLAPMVLLLPEHHVPHTVPTFVRLVIMVIISVVQLAYHMVDRVVMVH